jgi:uncharacterized membrane protein
MTPRHQVAAEPGSLELALAHVLELGTYVSVGLLALGAVLLLAGGTSPLAGGPPLRLDRLGSDLIALRPAGFLWLGILGMVATPGLRVLRAAIGFWRRGETTMAAVAVGVLVVIAVGVTIGVVAG